MLTFAIVFLLLSDSIVTATTSIASSPSGYRSNCNYTVGAAVKTTSGIVHGHRAPNASQVSEYLGIPYAAAPVRNLRFAPPVRFQGGGIINGSKFGCDCPVNIQNVPWFLPKNVFNILNQLAQAGDDISEDCLFINVWSKPQVGSSSKPVLVYLYGGGFNNGGTNTPARSGQFFADTEDVIFVNFNYRVNVFGFPGAPGAVQNVGLLDQRMAIEWVRDNAAAFGGDPSRITLVGQSAGAASIDYYNYAWTKDPIIAGAIMQSGTAISFGNKEPADAASAWYTVAEKVGCRDNATASADQVLACMRSSKVSMDDILAAERTTGLGAILGNFGPTVDNKTIFSNYTSLALSRSFNPVPTLLGTNDNEPGIFVLIAFGAGVTFSSAEWHNFSLQTFDCPAATAAHVRTLADVPTWRYRYFGMYPNMEVPTSGGKAWHGAELLPLFGSSEQVTGVESTWRERSVGAYMRGAWAAFARCPESGLEGYGWPRFEGGSEGTVVVLGRGNSTTAEFERAAEWDEECPVVFQGSSETLERLKAIEEAKKQKEGGR